MVLGLMHGHHGWHPLSACTLVDPDGNKITYAIPFKRIISLYPAHTENLLALGLDQELIGVSAGDAAAVAQGKEQFRATDNPEKFMAAKPDIILIRPMISRANPQLLSQLKEAGITIISLQPTSIDEMFSYWQTLGDLSGKASQAAAMIRTFQSELAAIQQTRDKVPVAARPRVYFESIH